MSIRNHYLGSIVKPGLNPLSATVINGYLYNLYGWGYNYFGQLALPTGYYSSPVQVGAGTTWSNISGGGYHSIALKTDGTLWTWGDNVQGQL